MSSRAGRTLAWSAFLVAALVALRLAATGALAAPPLDSLDAVGAWVDDRGAAGTALALVRLVAEVAAWYLLALSALHIAADIGRVRPARVIADALALPAARRVVHGALGVTMVTAAPLPGAHVPADPVADLAPDVHAGEVVREQVRRGTAVMRPVEQPSAPGTATMTPRPSPRTWAVHDGESFWTIAADVLTETWDRPPTDHEIDPFWRALVEANRDRLVDPREPDVIFPGQVFDVPPAPHR